MFFPYKIFILGMEYIFFLMEIYISIREYHPIIIGNIYSFLWMIISGEILKFAMDYFTFRVEYYIFI